MFDAFADFLKNERRYSVHTVRAYIADLRGLAAYAETQGQTDPRAWDLHLIRGYLARCETRDGKKLTPRWRRYRNPRRHRPRSQSRRSIGR